MIEATTDRMKEMRGIESLPQGWSIRPLKSFLRVRSERDEDLPLLSVYRDHGVVPFGSIEGNHNKPSLDLSNYKVVRDGDLVLNKMKTWQGSLAISDYEGIVSPAYIVCAVDGEWDRRYLHHLLRSPSYIAEYASLSYGIRVGQWDMRFDDFRKVLVFQPPLPAQRSIADYLDSETSRIDSLIDRKERFIELLLEKRTALITHAVTKGLDPDVEMKDSEAPWLGAVPVHWEIRPTKRLLSLHAEPVGARSADYTLLSLTLQGLIRRDMDSGMGKWPSSFDTYQVVRQGELVFCLFDVDETPRTVGLAQETGMVTGAYTVAETASDVEPEYIYYLFVSFDSDKRLKPLYSGLRKVIRPDRFLHAKMPFPPHSEQVEIVSFLNAETFKIDVLVDKTRRSIELLKEYRTALISAAVTGQIEIPVTDTGEDVV